MYTSNKRRTFCEERRQEHKYVMPFSCFWAEAETSVLPCFKKPCFLLYWPRASFDPYKERSKSAMCRSSHTILFSHITCSGSVTNNWLIASQTWCLLLIADSIGDEIDFLGDFSKGCFHFFPQKQLYLESWLPHTWHGRVARKSIGYSQKRLRRGLLINFCVHYNTLNLAFYEPAAAYQGDWNMSETGNNSAIYMKCM